MTTSETSLDDLLKAILVEQLEDFTHLREMNQLRSLATDAASVILGGINKDESSGQGCPIYLEAITKGQRYLMDTVFLLLNKEIQPDVAERLFEIALETQMLKFGDPYNTLNNPSFVEDHPRLLDTDDEGF